MSLGEKGGLPERLQHADSVYWSSNFDSAVVLLSGISDDAKAEGDHASLGLALTWLSFAHYRLGAYGPAREAAQEAVTLQEAHGLAEQLPRSHNALGLIASDESRLDDAQRHLELSAQLASDLGNRAAAAAATGNVGLVFTGRGDLIAARDRFDLQREVMADLRRSRPEAPPDSLDVWARAEGNALTNLAMIEVRRGDPEAALAFAERAMRIYREVDYATGMQNVVAHVGTAHAAMGDPQRAFVALDSALAQSRALGLERDVASNLEMLAELYRGAGDYGRTLELYREAQAINERLGLDLETAIDLRGEAEILVELGELEAAVALTEQALGIHREAGARLEELRDLLLLADVADLAGDRERSRVSLAEAGELAPMLGARVARTEVALAEAVIAERNGLPAEALEALARVEEDLERGVFETEWRASMIRSRAYAAESLLDSAAFWGQRALSAVERVRGRLGAVALRSSMTAARWDVYRHLVDIQLRRGRVDEAFVVADAARGRSLLEFTIGGEGRAGASSRLREAELLLGEIELVVSQIDAIEEFAPDERFDSEVEHLTFLYEELTRKRRAYESLLVEAGIADPDGMALLGGLRVSAGQVAEALRPGEALIEFMQVGDDRLVTFVVTRSGIDRIEHAIGKGDLENRVRLARDLMRRPEAPPEQLHLVLGGLYEALLASALERDSMREVSRLIVVPHGALTYLPFGALRDPEAGGYLVERYELQVEPSAAAFVALRSRFRAGDVGTGAAIFAPFPSELPSSAAEARRVSERLDARRRVGADATERRVREALSSSNVVHIATHGIMNPRSPMFSRVELSPGASPNRSDDGRLEVHEVLDLDVRASLVYLSGCETGLGAAFSTDYALGEDYVTMAQAFLFAGAESVVATLWPVDDEGAAAFAEAFYDDLDSGPAAALAHAQRAMLADPETAAPFYWAAYQVSGDGR